MRCRTPTTTAHVSPFCCWSVNILVQCSQCVLAPVQEMELTTTTSKSHTDDVMHRRRANLVSADLSRVASWESLYGNANGHRKSKKPPIHETFAMQGSMGSMAHMVGISEHFKGELTSSTGGGTMSRQTSQDSKSSLSKYRKHSSQSSNNASSSVVAIRPASEYDYHDVRRLPEPVALPPVTNGSGSALGVASSTSRRRHSAASSSTSGSTFQKQY